MQAGCASQAKTRFCRQAEAGRQGQLGRDADTRGGPAGIGTELEVAVNARDVVQVPQGHLPVGVGPQHPRLAIGAVGHRFGAPPGEGAIGDLAEPAAQGVIVPQ